jgi:hypothetical protein
MCLRSLKYQYYNFWTALCMHNVENETRLCNHCYCGNASKCFIIWERIFSLRHPACNARAPYCHLWPAQFYIIFQHYLINGTMFEKQVIEHKMCFDYIYNFFLKYFLRRIERDMTKNVWLKWESNSIQNCNTIHENLLTSSFHCKHW